MAFDFSKLNFFSRLDARSRVIFLAMGVVGVVFLVYVGTRYLFGGGETTGASRVATAPAGLQSIQGGTLTPQFARAVEQANVQRAQQAQLTGASAVPTQINIGQQAQPGAGQCVICYEETANVKTKLDDWLSKGQISPDIAQALQALADKNGSVDDYAAELERLVKEGKLTPEQARQLLEQYRKQHASKLLQDSANAMDAMIKAGQLPIDAANELLDAQKNNMTPAEYAALLQRLAREGKISPATAQQLLAQYTQQRAKEIVMKSIASLHKMAKEGKLTPDVENDLIDLENRMVPVDLYSAQLDRYVAQGKLVPVVAKAILDEFKSQKAAIGPSSTVSELLQKAEAEAYGEINDLMKAGKMPPDVGAQLIDMIRKDVPFEQYKAAVNQFVQQKKITPEIAKLKIGDYQKVKELREMAKRLAALQENNASPAAYADELKSDVQSGVITPEQAAQLMKEYQAMSAARTLPAAGVAVATTPEFARLQQRAQEAAVTTPVTEETGFAAAQAQAQEESAQDRQARIQALMTAMSGQAQQLVASWQPPAMSHKEGSSSESAAGKKKGTAAGAGGKEGESAASEALAGTPPLIKAGSILFAVLDTAVNSDYPDTPVLATIVDGKYKGAKLLGKLVTTKGVSVQWLLQV